MFSKKSISIHFFIIFSIFFIKPYSQDTLGIKQLNTYNLSFDSEGFNVTENDEEFVVELLSLEGSRIFYYGYEVGTLENHTSILGIKKSVLHVLYEDHIKKIELPSFRVIQRIELPKVFEGTLIFHQSTGNYIAFDFYELSGSYFEVYSESFDRLEKISPFGQQFYKTFKLCSDDLSDGFMIFQKQYPITSYAVYDFSLNKIYHFDNIKTKHISNLVILDNSLIYISDGTIWKHSLSNQKNVNKIQIGFSHFSVIQKYLNYIYVLDKKEKTVTKINVSKGKFSVDYSRINKLNINNQLGEFRIFEDKIIFIAEDLDDFSQFPRTTIYYKEIDGVGKNNSPQKLSEFQKKSTNTRFLKNHYIAISLNNSNLMIHEIK